MAVTVSASDETTEEENDDSAGDFERVEEDREQEAGLTRRIARLVQRKRRAEEDCDCHACRRLDQLEERILGMVVVHQETNEGGGGGPAAAVQSERPRENRRKHPISEAAIKKRREKELRMMWNRAIALLWNVLLAASRVYAAAVDLLFNTFHVFTTRHYVTRPTDDLLQISATQAADAIRRREVSSEALVEAYIRRIEQVNDVINAMVVRCFDAARAEARAVDQLIERATTQGDDGGAAALAKIASEQPLLGVPFTMKDALEAKGLVCSLGLKCRANEVSSKDAVVVARMRAAGAILLGITNVPEVCLWWETNNTLFGRSRNPYDSRRACGGSSGGEAALISAAGSLIGVGSDIGGSIRIPAHHNGVFGLMPTTGVVSLEGHLPEALGYRAQMLRVGPLCRYAQDLGLMFEVMAGPEETARLRLHEPVQMRRLKIFYMEGLRTPLAEPPGPEQSRALDNAVRYFEKKYDLAAIRVDLPLAHWAVQFFILSMAVPGAPPFSRYMANQKGDVNCFVELLRWCFGASAHTLPAIFVGIVDGRLRLSPEAERMVLYKRDRLIREMQELLGEEGILLFPTLPAPAWFHNQPLLKPLTFGYTALFNALALPAVCCPMGLSEKTGMPTSVSVVSWRGQDRLLLAAARDLEEGFGGWRPAAPLI